MPLCGPLNMPRRVSITRRRHASGFGSLSRGTQLLDAIAELALGLLFVATGALVLL